MREIQHSIARAIYYDPVPCLRHYWVVCGSNSSCLGLILQAAVVEIQRMNKTGRPVLVGTTSVEQSEMLADKLKEAGIKCQVRPGGYF